MTCWPGRQKLAGILLEAEAVATASPSWSASAPMSWRRRTDTPTPATSLKALGIDVSAEELFAALSDGWAEFRGIWDNGRGFAEIRRLWLERAAGLGQAVAINSAAASRSKARSTPSTTGLHDRPHRAGSRGADHGRRRLFRHAASAGAA